MRRENWTLPDFLGIGPGRTGTSWLHEVLVGHADLPSGVKETQFFNHNYAKGIDWYAAHFRRATGQRPVGEICPYFIDTEAPGRIKLHMPDCKLVVCFRDPVDHAYSNYKLLMAYAWARGSFEEVLETRPHIDRGNRYAPNLARWFDTFGRENVLVTWYEDLSANPQSYIDSFCQFAGIPKFALTVSKPGDKKVNEFQGPPRSRRVAQNARHAMYWLRDRRAYGIVNAMERAGVWAFCFSGGAPYPRLTPEQDARLRQRYLPEVEALEKLLGCDLSRWKRPREARAA
ncbi:MAG: sulfotransferase family protein [Candidatus Binataceae bacterium]